MAGARTDGTNELVPSRTVTGESTESWGDLLRDPKRRGMRAPVLAVGDGRPRAVGGAAGRCSRRRARSAARCTRWPMSSSLCRGRPTPPPLGARRDPRRRGPRPCPAGHSPPSSEGKWPKAVQRACRRRRAADLLRILSSVGGTLKPPTDRVHVLDGPAAYPGHQRARLASCRAGDGVRTHRVGPGAVARGQWPPPVPLAHAGVKFTKEVMVERPKQDDQEVAA